jgi:AbrB family looped-hinge helix DNA binding protein
VELTLLLFILTVDPVKARVTSKGQVTIPKALRDRFGIQPGGTVDFIETPDGIRLKKVVNATQGTAVLGCLKEELSGASVEEWMDSLRGPVEFPRECP